MRVIAVIALMILLANPVFAEEPFSVKTLNSVQSQFFVAGMAYAFGAANAEALLKGTTPIYCAAKVVGPSELWRLLQSRMAGPFDASTAAPGAAVELGIAYPCSGLPPSVDSGPLVEKKQAPSAGCPRGFKRLSSGGFCVPDKPLLRDPR